MKHGDSRREVVEKGAARIGIELSAEQVDSFLRYEELLRERAVPFGFIAASDAARVLERHILDSLRAIVEVRPTDRLAFDVGSGAGLPGLVVAIARPALGITVVEAQRRRVAFLELAIERLGLLNVEMFAARVESVPEADGDLAFTRAFAPAARSWAAAERVLGPRGRLVYFAGSAAPVQAPPGARVLATRPSPLESGGPLVIMAR